MHISARNFNCYFGKAQEVNTPKLCNSIALPKKPILPRAHRLTCCPLWAGLCKRKHACAVVCFSESWLILPILREKNVRTAIHNSRYPHDELSINWGWRPSYLPAGCLLHVALMHVWRGVVFYWYTTWQPLHASCSVRLRVLHRLVHSSQHWLNSWWSVLDR